MIKQIKKGRYRSDKHFIIEISFIFQINEKKLSYLCLLVTI